MIAEELALRHEIGVGVDLIELRQRFPQWQEQVTILARCHHLLAGPKFPDVGESIGDFQLQAELGRGAVGRVYLATQPSLAGRPVVLKLSPEHDGEHLSLGRLQHTHIVPLFSVHEFPQHGLHGLCLPYLGGTTLAKLLDALKDRSPNQRTGRDLRAGLQHVKTDHPIPIPIAGPARRFLEQASYSQTICWIGMCLAEALQHAHDRGLLHLDIKPSNILLAADAQPMLLDFHLAHRSIPAGASGPFSLGGTPRYMAPEHRAAMAATREGRAVPMAVDGRADIYGLALVLLEALGGSIPVTSRIAAGLHAANPAVTTRLALLLEKCLASEAARRYGSMGELAADLRRYLADLPLRGVPNRSPKERWQCWRRRQPYALPLLGLGAIFVTGVGLLYGHVHRLSDRAEAAWHQGEQYLVAGRPGEARENFQHGIALMGDFPANRNLLGQLTRGVEQAERMEAAAQLHQSAEQIRALYGVDLPAVKAQAVKSICARFWESRERIVQGLGCLPDPKLQDQVRADLLDVAILWSDVHVGHAAPEQVQHAREEAVATLVEAEALFGSSCVLREEGREYRRLLGHSIRDEGPSPPPRNAWEHYALGRLHLRAGEVKQAAAEFDRSLALQPQALWANFYKGRCTLQTGAYEDAVIAFSVCAILSPTSAWPVCLRGQAYLEEGRLDRAGSDFDTALRLDPWLVPAIWGRGFVHYRQEQHPEAMANLRRVLELEPRHEQAPKLLAQLKQLP